MKRVLLIGAGYWGEKLLERFLGLIPEKTVMVAESNPERRAVIAEKYGVQTALQYIDLLAEADACVIATPIPTHADLVRECLNAGKHVLCEKPLAMDETVNQLLELAQKNRLTLMADHTFLYTDYMLREFPANSPRPRVNFIDAHWENPKIDTPDEGILWTLAPHPVSLALHIMGRPVWHIEGEVGPREIDLSTTFLGGDVAKVTATWETDGHERSIIIGFPNRVEEVHFEDLEQNPDPLSMMCGMFLSRIEPDRAPYIDRLGARVVNTLWLADHLPGGGENWPDNGH